MCKESGKKNEPDDYYIVLEELGWFADNDKRTKNIKVKYYPYDKKDKENKKYIEEDKETKMAPRNNRKYNKYETKDYIFIYQYWDINNDESITIIADEIKKNINMAKKVLVSNNFKAHFIYEQIAGV